ncbi:si:ch211-191a24.3 isoform X3 [Carassius carassius]|uniref:si:ch211-191a24.3 isoform X3 n=1 Tax=Carassius carassius TaxID=217509 RepID=UPI002868CC0C|nr:si:ch211-191a24.3 isoform X3 [Carassius carassius]
MAEGSEFDLDYITERIIGLTFLQSCTEQTYQHNLHSITQMLRSKHADRYMVINLTERSDDLSRMNHRVVDLGWPEQHAPSLHLLCSVCKNMDSWLRAYSENVLLLHCKGCKDRVGVVISSYVQLANVSTSEEHALDLYSMKKFCRDKMGNLMTPSQKRYVQAFGRLLTHQIHINSSPLFIHGINIHPVPDFHPTVCQLFIRVYQDTQTVYTSGVQQVAVGQTDRVCFVLEPPQMLKGDFMIVCYHKNDSMRTHETVFRVQFHTSTLCGDKLSLQKEDLDHANIDPRFPEDGVVEVLFSEIANRGPSLASDCGHWNSSAVDMENDTLNSLHTQWDFTENLTAAAKQKEGTHSLSSDSGLSSSSQWTGGQASGLPISYSSEEHPQLSRVNPGLSMEEEQPSPGILRYDHKASQDAFDHSSHLNGECQNSIQSDDCQSEAPPVIFREDVNSSNTLIHTSVPAGYQTHIWVKQQQSTSYMHTSSDGLEHREEMELQKGANKPSLPDNGFPEAQSEPDKDDEFATLALDVDQSIEQLNQLILDLDPDFEPVSTQARSHMTRSASLDTNGKTHFGGRAKFHQSGWRHKQLSDVSEYSVLRSAGSDRMENKQRFIFGKPSLRGLYHTDSVDIGDLPPEADSPLWVFLDQVPPTPAFPVTPPTPYVKSGHDFIPSRSSSQTSRHYMSSPIWQESRGYVDSISSDGELYHSDVTGSPTSCQRMFGSMHSISTPSPLVNTDSPTLAHSWLEGGSSTPLSHYTPQPSPPLTLSAPNSHSSPCGAPCGLSSSLDVEGLESSLLEAVEGLEALGLDVAQPHLLPLKRRGTEGSETMFPFSRSGISTSYASHNTSPTRSTPSPDFMASKPENVKFVQDTSKFWYKPDISREQAIAILKDKEPGSFIIRDSHSFRGAYGLAMKVATPPPSILQQSRKMGDLSSELVRHFLIECTSKGVRLKGCPNEPYFGSLTALVCQHSITPLALPCRLIIPKRDPLEELNESSSQTSTNSAAELLKQGAACNVWFLGSVDLESLTGVQGVQKATTGIFSMDPAPTSTVVHFKVSAQGITLTDNQRKLFFRRHYAVNTVIFCALDPQDRKWTRDGCTAAKIFGFIARKSGSSTENVCHLFAEHDPEQPASAIVNFVSKVMIGSQKTK